MSTLQQFHPTPSIPRNRQYYSRKYTCTKRQQHLAVQVLLLQLINAIAICSVEQRVPLRGGESLGKVGKRDL